MAKSILHYFILSVVFYTQLRTVEKTQKQSQTKERDSPKHWTYYNNIGYTPYFGIKVLYISKNVIRTETESVNIRKCQNPPNRQQIRNCLNCFLLLLPLLLQQQGQFKNNNNNKNQEKIAPTYYDTHDVKFTFLFGSLKYE